jgi:hypothetical protein
LNMKNFLFQAIEGIKTLKIEGIGHNVEEHWKVHRECCVWALGLKIFYTYIF